MGGGGPEWVEGTAAPVFGAPQREPLNLSPVGTEEGFVPMSPFAVQTFPLGYLPLSLLTLTLRSSVHLRSLQGPQAPALAHPWGGRTVSLAGRRVLGRLTPRVPAGSKNRNVSWSPSLVSASLPSEGFH